jgi:flavorubredoxin
MQEKAAVVLREALSVSVCMRVFLLCNKNKISQIIFLFVQLQEKVLGPHHPTVMSTLDSLADTCAAANHGPLGLKYYNEILERFHDQEEESKLEEAVIFYKMSKIHKQANDLESQLTKLHFASKVLLMEDSMTNERKQLEHQIQVDIRSARKEFEEQELQWV